MGQQTALTDINLPETRMVGRAPDQRWHWKFGDNQWRDMMQSITMDMQKEEVTKLPDWLGGAVIKKGRFLPSWSDVGRWTGLGGDYPKVVADFDALRERTDLLPDGFEQTASTEYMLALAELWREVTGFVPAKGNQTARYDPNQTYKQNIDTDEELFKIAGDLADDMGWDKIATARGYDIDWSDPGAVGHFMMMTHDDHIRGNTYDDDASLRSGANTLASFSGAGDIGGDLGSAGVVENIEAGKTQTIDTKAGTASATDRKVVGNYGKGPGAEPMARAAATQRPDAMVEQRNGEWVVTVSPGTGGFDNLEASDAWLTESGLDATKWESVPIGQGKFDVREKRAAEDTQGHDTVAEARTALEATGADPTQYEYRAGNDGKIYPVYTGKQPGGQFDTRMEAQGWLYDSGLLPKDIDRFEVVPGPEGKWIVREKPAYSTPTRTVDGETVPGTPGEMFEPTITEDPTGRKFGLDASGRLTDFGYGMAGDITQEELAGYQVPSRSLDEIIGKAIERGNWELARGVQAFKDRPTERDLLDYAAQFAEAPADLAVLSAIARGEQMVQPAVPLPEGMGTGMGQPTRIGAPGEVYTSAYKTFLDAMNQGFVPNEQELRDLFDPKKDPTFIATQELADKYETQIGNLRNEIAEANKSASERIENTQTNTMNMMTGMFENTIASFKDVLEKTTSMNDTEITRLTDQINAMRTGTTASTSSDADPGPAPSGPSDSSSASGDTGEWFDTLWDPVAGTYKEYNLNNATEKANYEAALAQGHVNKNDQTGVWGVKYDITPKDPPKGLPEETPESDFVQMGQLPSGGVAPADVVQSFGQYQANPGSPSWDIVGDAPRQAATESQFVYQAADKDWGGREEREKPLEQQSWQAQYFAPQVEAEKAAFSRGQMDPWEFEGAEGGVVQGPTMALLGEKEPEFIVPFSKVDEFKQGFLPLGQPRQTRRGSTVAKFEDAIPRFANGGLVTGPRFGGVTARGLTTIGSPTGEGSAWTTPAIKEELDLGEEGRYGGDATRAPRISGSDFESLLTRYAEPESRRYLSDPGTRSVQLGNIPEYELRQRMGASEFAGTNPAQHPIGIQQLMAGRPISRPQSLMTAANMPTPSGQALRNMLPSERAYYQKMGRMAGIPQEELEQEMRSAMPGGTRRTPLRMGARRVRQA